MMREELQDGLRSPSIRGIMLSAQQPLSLVRTDILGRSTEVGADDRDLYYDDLFPRRGQSERE